MGKKKVQEIRCEVEFSEGKEKAQERIAEVLCDIWMRVRDGKLECEALDKRMRQYDAERNSVRRDAAGHIV